MKYAVQQRILRVKHSYSKYCVVLWNYLKSFAVKHHEICHLICVEDKAIIPVGNPSVPVSTNVRRLNASLVAGNTQLLALDHDYHVAGIVPSILLYVRVLESTDDSFYKGRLQVTVKDKIL